MPVPGTVRHCIYFIESAVVAVKETLNYVVDNYSIQIPGGFQDMPGVYPTKPSSKAHRTLVPNFGIGAVVRVDETCCYWSGESERGRGYRTL